MLDQSQVHKFIIHELAEGHDADQVTSQVCEQFGMVWSDAQEMVKLAGSENATNIALRQAPWVFPLAIVTLLAGMMLAAYSLWLASLIASATINSGSPLGLAELIIRIPGLIQRAGFPFVLGISMMAGSVLGMRDFWASLFEKLFG